MRCSTVAQWSESNCVIQIVRFYWSSPIINAYLNYIEPDYRSRVNAWQDCEIRRANSWHLILKRQRIRQS